MAGLNWSRLDANIATNHKTLHLMGERGGDHAMLVYLFSHGYCIGQGTDGFIPRAALGTFHGTVRDATLLVDVGFWDEVPGGWTVHDWHDYQPSSEEQQKRSQRARELAAARWSNAPRNASGNAARKAVRIKEKGA